MNKIKIPKGWTFKYFEIEGDRIKFVYEDEFRDEHIYYDYKEHIPTYKELQNKIEELEEYIEELKEEIKIKNRTICHQSIIIMNANEYLENYSNGEFDFDKLTNILIGEE